MHRCFIVIKGNFILNIVFQGYMFILHSENHTESFVLSTMDSLCITIQNTNHCGTHLHLERNNNPLSIRQYISKINQ